MIEQQNRRRASSRVFAGALALALVAIVAVAAVAQAFGPATGAAAPALSQTVQNTSLAAPAGSVAAVAQSTGPAVVSVRTNEGLGSGVIYDPSGLVLTNAHVVENAQSITIALVDGRHFSGKVVGSDPGFDVAVIDIDGQNLPTASLGTSSQLQVGQDVIAIGNPFGLDHTLTTGVISALNRPVSEGPGSYNQPMIQIDAAINPGNSGGPLLDLNGQVIGINTLGAAPMGFPAQGLGFAVPVDTARRISDQLVQQGKVTRSGMPYLGVSLSDINRPDAVPGLPGTPFPGFPGMPGGRRGNGGGVTPRPTPPAGADHGALVGDVASGSAAAQAGIQPSDVIVSFDSFDIYNPDELLQRLVVHKPGDQVNASVLRDGQTVNVTITIGEAPVSS